jgi:hypothetical protein
MKQLVKCLRDTTVSMIRVSGNPWLSRSVHWPARPKEWVCSHVHEADTIRFFFGKAPKKPRERKKCTQRRHTFEANKHRHESGCLRRWGMGILGPWPPVLPVRTHFSLTRFVWFNTASPPSDPALPSSFCPPDLDYAPILQARVSSS